MAKIQIKSETIATFGGIFHIMDVFEGLGLDKLIDSCLGKREASWNAFRFSEVVETFFCNYLCGGDYLEDINMLAPQLSLRPGTRVPSSDTVGRVLKSLATGNVSYTCEKSGFTYDFNTAEKLNVLLLRMIKALGLLKAGEEVTLDFDHQFIPAHKFDAKYSYKKDFGYFPGWASVGGILVGGENRDGNTNVKFRQADTLARIMDRAKRELGIVIREFRADCGSFSKEIIKAVEPRCEHFYIRASNCSSRYEDFREYNGWQSAEIDCQECELASFDYEMDESAYRLVVQRSPKKEDGRIVTDMFGTVYVYRAIITNDREMSEKDVVLFYNKRGESEKNFDIQNNDFGWAHLPFSFMNENTVFMLFTAMLKNYFLYLTQTLSRSIKAIKKTSRLKKVLFHFICVPAKWIKSGRKNILKLYTQRSYYREILGPCFPSHVGVHASIPISLGGGTCAHTPTFTPAL